MTTALSTAAASTMLSERRRMELAAFPHLAAWEALAAAARSRPAPAGGAGTPAFCRRRDRNAAATSRRNPTQTTTQPNPTVHPTQSNCPVTSGGQKYADHYIRFENLQTDYDAVCRLLRLPLASLPKAMTEVRKKDDAYRDYYTDWSRQYVARLCHKMIDAFDYRF